MDQRITEGNRVWAHYLSPEVFRSLLNRVNDLKRLIRSLDEDVCFLADSLVMMSTMKSYPDGDRPEPPQPPGIRPDRTTG